MSATVFDCVHDCSGYAAGLRAAGYEAIIRYYSVFAWKRIGASEAQAVTSAGLKLATVYQDRQNQAGDFSASKGNLAGNNAFSYAQTVIMQPTQSAIYFSVDFDASQLEIDNNIVPFFNGVRQAMLAANGGIELPYKIGVYGSGRTCKALKSLTLVDYTWLTQSTGFADYQVFLSSDTWNLSQKMPANVSGVDGDPNNVNLKLSDFGAFNLPSDHFGPALPSALATSFTVSASGGVRLRGGPGTNFDVLYVLPFGTPVTVVGRQGDWAQVSRSSPSVIDGYVFASYLRTSAST